ncbi:MAG: hypothetical protein WC055_15920 [Melioribacteraceae bacterium]
MTITTKFNKGERAYFFFKNEIYVDVIREIRYVDGLISYIFINESLFVSGEFSFGGKLLKRENQLGKSATDLIENLERNIIDLT